MSCELCYGSPACPVCGEEKYADCPECEGEGVIRDEDGELERCEYCDGYGTVEIENV